MIADIEYLEQFETQETLESRDLLEDISPGQFLKVDCSAYINSKHNEKTLARKNPSAYRNFVKKRTMLEGYTAAEVMEILGATNGDGNKNTLWACYHNNYNFKINFPIGYPHCVFEKTKKEVAISNIDVILRFGGHFHAQALTLFVFWIEHERDAIYKHTN